MIDSLAKHFRTRFSPYEVEVFYWIERRNSWDHLGMFQNARKKVMGNGYFVLITVNAEARTWQTEDFDLVHESDIAVGDQLLKLVIWHYIPNNEANRITGHA